MKFHTNIVLAGTVLAWLLVTGVVLGEEKKAAKSDTTINVLIGKPMTATVKGRPTLHLMGDTIMTASGLKYIDVVPGTGGQPREGQVVSIHYICRFPDGKQFKSSRDDSIPYDFRLGKGEVIKGLDEGVASMNIGSLRRLFIPYQLAYGEQGHPSGIPPKTNLVYEVELLGVK